MYVCMFVKLIRLMQVIYLAVVVSLHVEPLFIHAVLYLIIDHTYTYVRMATPHGQIFTHTVQHKILKLFGKENVDEFTTIANISYFSESGIWLGKILANDARLAKFTKVFTRQNFVLYGTYVRRCV